MFFDTIIYHVRSWFMFSVRNVSVLYILYLKTQSYHGSLYLFIDIYEMCLKIASPLFLCGYMDIILNIDVYEI